MHKFTLAIICFKYNDSITVGIQTKREYSNIIGEALPWNKVHVERRSPKLPTYHAAESRGVNHGGGWESHSPILDRCCGGSQGVEDGS